jgi:hypothetical protein
MNLLDDPLGVIDMFDSCKHDHRIEKTVFKGETNGEIVVNQLYTLRSELPNCGLLENLVHSELALEVELTQGVGEAATTNI